MHPEEAPVVALLSPSGWGNLGDAAIVESAIRAVRKRIPSARILGLTLNPPDTAQRHNIDAYTCTGFSRPYYGVAVYAPYAAPGRESGEAQLPPASRSSWRATLRRLALVRHAYLAVANVRAIPAELRHRRLVAEPTRALKYLVVAGGGQLDDFWGGAFGHPYVLWRWMRHARERGAATLVLSVGTGTLVTPLARHFVHRALALADYRSFRDEGSRKLIEDAAVQHDPVVPDLAYGLPVEELYIPRSPDPRRRMIGLSPIAYCDPSAWPVADAARFRAYFEAFAALAVRLLEAGHELVLYGTDSPDLHIVKALRDELSRRVPALMPRVHTPEVTSLEQLFEALAEVEMVIASRLHGVLLAHLLGLPVGALSYERKVGTLMRTMGHERYCLSIDGFDPAAAFECFERLFDDRAQVSSDVRRIVAGFRHEVELQYDRVFHPATSQELQS